MKVRRLVLVFALGVIVSFVGAKQGLTYVQAAYGAPCAKLEGFGGFLQEMNFLAQGTCKIKPGTANKCQNTAACTVSGPSGTNTGKCSDAIGTCTCVVN